MFKENSNASLPCCSLQSISQTIHNLGESIANLNIICFSSPQTNKQHNYQSPARERENENIVCLTPPQTSQKHTYLTPIIESEHEHDDWQDISGYGSCCEN